MGFAARVTGLAGQGQGLLVQFLCFSISAFCPLDLGQDVKAVRFKTRIAGQAGQVKSSIGQLFPLRYANLAVGEIGQLVQGAGLKGLIQILQRQPPGDRQVT